LSRNNARVTAALMFLGVCYAAVLPAFAAVLVPSRYAADFVHLSLILTPGIVLFCLVQFALGPIFQLQRRTWPLTVAALAALATDLALQQAVPGAGTAQIAAIHAGSLGVAFLVGCGFALRHRECHPALREIAVILLAALVTGAALWPTREIAEPWLALVAAGIVGPCIFAGTLALFDAAGLRDFARLAIARWRARGAVGP
jgi:O-antigen/teichoic acid export membrane protein